MLKIQLICIYYCVGVSLNHICDRRRFNFIINAISKVPKRLKNNAENITSRSFSPYGIISVMRYVAFLLEVG